jgi:hypothetical protein
VRPEVRWIDGVMSFLFFSSFSFHFLQRRCGSTGQWVRSVKQRRGGGGAEELSRARACLWSTGAHGCGNLGSPRLGFAAIVVLMPTVIVVPS